MGDGFQPLGLAGEDLDKAVAAMKAAAVKADRDPADVSLVLGATLPRLDEAKLEWARGLGADRIVLSASRRGTSLELIIDEMAECSKRLGLSN